MVMNFQQNDFSLFEKSRPDFTCIKVDRESKKVGVVAVWKVSGTIVKFKMNVTDSSNYPQAFANLIKVSNTILVNALNSGQLIDTVIVYGLLVSYIDETSIPMKLMLDFTTGNNSRIQVAPQC